MIPSEYNYLVPLIFYYNSRKLACQNREIGLPVVRRWLDKREGKRDVVYYTCTYARVLSAVRQNPGGVLPIMDYTGRLRPKGVPF